MRRILDLHPTEPFLGREGLLVCRETTFDAGFLEVLECRPIGGLLVGIVLGEHRALFFAVRALNVVDPFGCDAQALVEVFLLLFQLLDLEAHQSVLAQVFHVLETRSATGVQGDGNSDGPRWTP